MTKQLNSSVLIASIVAFPLTWTIASAQIISDPVDIALLPVQYAFTRLAPDILAAQVPFQADATAGSHVSIRIRSTSPLAHTGIQPPNQPGVEITSINVGNFGGSFASFDGGLPGPFLFPTNDPGHQYIYDFLSQGPGQYAINLTVDPGIAGDVAVITEVILESPVAVSLIAVTPEVNNGGKAVITAAIFEGVNPVHGANVPVTIIAPNGTVSPISPLTLLDRGEFPKGDEKAGDGLYSGVFTVQQIGEYTLHSTITGKRSNGVAFQRDAGTTVRVRPQCAELKGFLADYGQDDNNNGRYEWLVIEAETNVYDGGEYILQVALETASGKTLQAYGSSLQNFGVRQIKARVSSDDIQEAAEPGPYTVRWVSLYCVGDEGALSAGRFNPGTKTHPYRLEQFEPPPPPDCNHNGIGDPAEIEYGLVTDCDSNGIPDDCPCPDCPCPVGLISTTVPANPPSLTRDARQPHPSSSNELTARQGIGSADEPISIKLTTCGNIKPACFQLCESGQEELDTSPVTYVAANQVVNVKQSYTDPYTYEVVLARPISARHWTTIKYWSGSKKLSYASMPADVNLDNYSTSADVAAIQSCLSNPVLCTSPVYRKDIDHSGTFDAADVNIVSELLAGVGTFIPWNGRVLATNICAQSGGGGPYCPSSPCGGGTDPQSMMMSGGSGGIEGMDLTLEFDESSTGELVEPELNENAHIANGFAELLTETNPVSEQDVTLFNSHVSTMTDWCAQNFSAEEKAPFVEWLASPSRTFASEVGRNAAMGVIAALSP